MNGKKRKASALDLAMAGLAGASVAFVIFAMPHGAFEEAVGLSGLPLILPAAAPPLGETARLLAAALAGAATFAFAWLVLRSIGKKPAQAKKAFQPVELAELDVAPKLRRADAHPDAPARRPILAGLDLGEPAEPEAAEEPAAAPLAEEPEEAPEVAEEAAAPPEATEHPVEEGPVQGEAEAPEAIEQNSIPHLMQRLEQGLLRRERQGQGAKAPAPFSSASPPEQARIDERLRGAIADLQKLATRSS